ncbi:hypothetical protein RF11_01790 [Thelohanellus kitauei]|uniref:Sortilin C-terminal domain-containing protein n=1 Tax=Thelohanellus kitauei TaxID=669202 RepID=A0A0C2J8N7_THEKT|nr:hypothetical protein RF11_01790 [Thelohanellus kitauei]
MFENGQEHSPGFMISDDGGFFWRNLRISLIQIGLGLDDIKILNEGEVIVDRKCDISDYQILTPGSDDVKRCFHGQKDILYSKYVSKICESNIKELPTIVPKSCECTPEDYRWYDS